MNPEYSIYIVSKGRWKSRLTSEALEKMNVPYYIVVEEQEYKQYSSVVDKKKILILDKKYQDEYDTFDDLGYSKSKGPGPARNFVWEHSISENAKFHWVMDDNITWFARLNHNMNRKVVDGTIFRCMEDFVNRYENIAMAGPQSDHFVVRKTKMPPYVINTRVYSCNLIRNDLPFRWRGRYNEDTDLSIRILKAGWCTIQFYAFIMDKVPTQTQGGGNTKDFYAKEGTLPKSKMLFLMHPDVTKIVWKFNRWHHHVDYGSFKKNKLKLREGIEIPEGINNYGMKLVNI